MANTNSGGKLFICATAQALDLNLAAYAALTWLEVGGVGSVGEIGSATNILTYDTWGGSVIQKGKGMTDAGSPDIEISRDSVNAGQDALRAAAATNLNYAFKIEKADKLTLAGTNTVIYNRGIVVGPKRPMGRNEDFDLEVFTLGFQQLEIIVDPT